MLTAEPKGKGEKPQGEDIVHTGSGGAFEETEQPVEESSRELSDEQLDELLEEEEDEPGDEAGSTY